MRAYSFRTATEANLPMLAEWLKTSESVRWWGESGEQLALIREDLAIDEMRQWIVTCDGVPFAYAQAYEVHTWPQPHLAHLPAGTMAVDTFIGVAEMVGRGHGGAFLHLLAERLIADGAPLVAIDPDSANTRAHKAYRNAGFCDEATVETDTGPALLMIFRPG